MSSLHTRGHHGIHDDIGTNMTTTMVAMLMMPQDLAGKPCHSSECSRRRRCSTEHRRRPRASVPAHPCSDNHASADDYLTRTRPQPCRRSRRCDLARELRHLTKQRVSRRRLKLAPTCQYDSQPTNQLTNHTIPVEHPQPSEDVLTCPWAFHLPCLDKNQQHDIYHPFITIRQRFNVSLRLLFCYCRLILVTRIFVMLCFG